MMSTLTNGSTVRVSLAPAIRFAGALATGLAGLATVVACGGNSADSQPPAPAANGPAHAQGGSQAALPQCNALCDAQAANRCPNLLDLPECKQVCGQFAQAADPCRNDMEAHSACQLSAPNLCDIGPSCATEREAFARGCLGG